MNTSISLHDVAKITVKSDVSMHPVFGTFRWQDLELFDSKGHKIGQITLHLADASAAMLIGDMPPYWGVDLNSPTAMACMDEREEEEIDPLDVATF